MNPFDKIASMSMSGMRAQANRMQIVSENLANADTHGYKRKLITFENVFDRNTGANNVEVGRVTLDSKAGDRLFDPDHPFADAEGYVVTSNVNIMTEFADASESRRSYDAGLEVFRQAREMYGSLLDILRR